MAAALIDYPGFRRDSVAVPRYPTYYESRPAGSSTATDWASLSPFNVPTAIAYSVEGRGLRLVFSYPDGEEAERGDVPVPGTGVFLRLGTWNKKIIEVIVTDANTFLEHPVIDPTQTAVISSRFEGRVAVVFERSVDLVNVILREIAPPLREAIKSKTALPSQPVSEQRARQRAK